MQDREPLDWSWLTYSRLRVLRELGADRTERQAANVYAVPGDTGWQVDWVTANYYGQYVPAQALQGFGMAQFVWNLHLYRHTHEANTIVYGDGFCDAEFGLTGTVPGNWSYATHDIHWE